MKLNSSIYSLKVSLTLLLLFFSCSMQALIDTTSEQIRPNSVFITIDKELQFKLHQALSKIPVNKKTVHTHIIFELIKQKSTPLPTRHLMLALINLYNASTISTRSIQSNNKSKFEFYALLQKSLNHNSTFARFLTSFLYSNW